MCGRFTHLYTWAQLHRLMRLTSPEPDEPHLFDPRYNLAPTQRAPAIVQHGPERAARGMVFGFVPVFSKDGKPGPINARAETAASKPMFRAAVARHRCLVPASGFYEWEAVEGERTKQPWYFTPARGEILRFAGLFSHWDGPEGRVESFAILTCAPNATMARIHDRMPVILDDDAAEQWLDPKADAEHASALCVPAPEGTLAGVRVSTRVNSPRNDSPDLIEQVDEPRTLFE